MRARIIFPTLLLFGVPGVALAAPAIDVQIKPLRDNDVVSSLEVRIRLSAPQVTPGGKLVRLLLTAAATPSVRLDGDALQAQDDDGALRLSAVDGPALNGVQYRHWNVERATRGDVLLNYRAQPRVVTASTRPGPHLDIRAESGGVFGSGMMLVPVPDNELEYAISLRWDLSAMPSGARGVWSYGEGDLTFRGRVEKIAAAFLMAGPIQSIPLDAKARFASYWLTPPNFDVQQVAVNVERFYRFAADFFRDPDGEYRVFIRRNPYRGTGGNGLTRSFAFGWHDGRQDTPDSLHDFLAHEVTHAWPALQEPYGKGIWYDEGNAEYFSVLMSRLAGVYDDDRFLAELNKKASTYYRNELRDLTNDRQAEIAWQDPRANVLPYGRGFLYLAMVDGQLNNRSNGRVRLRDLVVAMFQRKAAGQSYNTDAWLDLVSKELGPRARRDFEAMRAGKLLVAHGSFAPCLKIEKFREPQFDVGFNAAVLNLPNKIVTGLRAGSKAAAAGLRDGDVIVEWSPFRELQSTPDRRQRMELTVKRGEQLVKIGYLPQGKLIDSYRWRRVLGVAHDRCSF